MKANAKERKALRELTWDELLFLMPGIGEWTTNLVVRDKNTGACPVCQLGRMFGFPFKLGAWSAGGCMGLDCDLVDRIVDAADQSQTDDFRELRAYAR